jgi:hypothetical protein
MLVASAVIVLVSEAVVESVVASRVYDSVSKETLVSHSIEVELGVCKGVDFELESTEEMPEDSLTKSVIVSIVVVSDVKSSLIDVGSTDAFKDDVVAADVVISTEAGLVVVMMPVLAAEDDGGLVDAIGMLMSTVPDNRLAVSREVLVFDIGASRVEVVASNDSSLVASTTPTDVSSVMIASGVLVRNSIVLA